MPLDVDAPVVANRRLSRDYNVIVLSAPEIARGASPGQFVMIKPGAGHDPLLRRPFSIFEVLRNAEGLIVGLSLLNKRIGPVTRLIFDAEPGARIQCLGPLGRPFVAIGPPMEAWMVAGGVGLAPFATLAEILCARGVRTTLFYGARRGEELFYLDFFRAVGCRLTLATEDGVCGTHGRITEPLEQALRALPPDAPLMIYACGPEPMLAAVSQLAAAHGRPVQVSVERVMGCGLGGCYSCVIPVRDEDGRSHFVRSCLAGPVFSGEQILWK